MYFNLIEKTLKNYLIHIVCGIVFTFLIVCLQGVALNNRIYFLIPILTFSMFLVCIYILVINHIFMMKKKYIKTNILNWLLTIFIIFHIGSTIIERGYDSIPAPIALLASFIAVFMSFKQSIIK